MKRLGLALVCSVALTSCKSAPVYDECIITIEADSQGLVVDAVADCMRPDKTIYVKRGAELDGMYAYSAEHRANIIKWGKTMCQGRSGN